MFTTRPEIAGTFGVVATTHWIASSVGMAVLEKGGNAFDAAAAAAFVLQVAEPHLNGPGGDAPIIIHDAHTAAQHVICGQGVSPDAATPERFASLGLDLVPGTGLLPAVVPGAFDGWMLMLRDWGTWELNDVLAYAIAYAKNGIHIVPRISAAIENVRPLFEAEWHSSAAVFLPGGRVPAPGTLFARPVLAETWQRVLREATGSSRQARIDGARNAWYRGFVADAIGKFYRANEVLDSSGRRHRGLLTADDMGRWAASVEDPVSLDYHGHTVLKVGPWSQGPVLLQQLALLSGFDIGAMDPLGADFAHTVIECAKLAFADREAYYGDPDFAQVPLNALLSPAYNDERRKLVTDRASMELRPGRVDGFDPIVDHNAADRVALLNRVPGADEPTVARLGATGGDTCHIDIIDRWGNMVSATPVGRLAAILACGAGAWFLHQHPRPDVLDQARPPQQRGTPQAAAHDAVAQPGIAWRQTLDELRHARRRTAGSVADHDVPAHGPSQHEHPAIRRRAELPHRALAQQLLAACRPPRQGSPRRSLRRRRADRAQRPWPFGRNGRRLERGPNFRRPDRAGRADVRRRQPKGHARVRGRPLKRWTRLRERIRKAPRGHGG